MRKVARLFVTALLGAAVSTAAAPITVALAQDDWLRVPSSDDSSPSQPPNNSTSNNSAPQDSGSASGHPQRGSDNAAVTIVEYSDFQCPFCRRAEASIREVLKKYGDQVRLVYMDFPLPSHVHAMDAAIAARCADEQGQFWPYHDALFDNSPALTTEGLKATASQVGLDPLTFDRCLEERKYENAILADQKEGDAAGLRGIPYFIVDGQVMHGATTPAAFDTAIDRDLKSR